MYPPSLLSSLPQYIINTSKLNHLVEPQYYHVSPLFKTLQ